MPHTLQNYADWVKGQVLGMGPHDRVRNDWIPNWSRTLQAIERADGIFELISVICSKWEFLGSLYLGTGGNSGVAEAKTFADLFVAQVNPQYFTLHNLSGGASSNASEFFSTFRNRPLHGGTPAGVTVSGGTDVLAWMIGFGPSLIQTHLKQHNNNLNVFGSSFKSEFLASLVHYADYLGANTDYQNGKLPAERFQMAFWRCFHPFHLPKSIWETEGKNRGVPF